MSNAWDFTTPVWYEHADTYPTFEAGPVITEAEVYQTIWERYSNFNIRPGIWVKRLLRNGTYEAEWQEVPQRMIADNTVSRLQRALPNSSYQFGQVQVANASLSIINPYREFSGERIPGSMFKGYLRHWSQIKVIYSIEDNYGLNLIDAQPGETIPRILITAFIGLIDDTTATTDEDGRESLTALDFITVLDQVNVKDLALTKTKLSELVYEVMYRQPFVKYFNVENTADYIHPGYDAEDIDTSVYDGSVLEMLQDLAKGHSIFYIDPEDNYFYFREALPTDAVKFNFLEQNNRKLSVSQYREGRDRQITAWYWGNLEEFLTSDNWTSAGWTGSSSNWKHTVGNTSALSEPTPTEPEIGYEITYTVTDRTAGSFSVSLGGISESSITASGSISLRAISRAHLNVVPSTDFNGTVKLSVKPVISAIASAVAPIIENLDIKGITNNTQRQRTLNFVLNKTRSAKPYFKLEIPFFPIIKIMDKVILQNYGSAPLGSARWGMFIWTESDTNNPNVAPRWIKPAGIKISAKNRWMVRGITHDQNLKTTLELEFIS